MNNVVFQEDNSNGVEKQNIQGRKKCPIKYKSVLKHKLFLSKYVQYFQHELGLSSLKVF